MAEERNPVVPPPASPLAPDLPVATPLVASELDDDPVRATAAGSPAAPLPGSLATPAPGVSGTLPGDTRSAAPAVPASAASDDPEVIREQIERTREDMSATLNELQERLSPQHLAQQAKESVREATVGRVQQLVGVAGERAGVVAARAQDVAGTAVEQAREHPLPVALAGAGAGLVWWLMRRSSGRQWNADDMYDWDDADMSYERDYASLDVRRDDDWRGQTWNAEHASGWTRVLRDNPVPASIAAASIGYMLWNRRRADWSDDGVVTRSAYAYGDDLLDDGSARSSASAAASSLAEGARDVSRQAREKASAISEQVTDSVRSAQARAGEVSRDVSRRLRTARTQTTSQFDRWMRENPLAVGIAAIAAGAVVGLTMPRTRTEDEMLGASRDALMERATDSAQQIKEQVREKVQTVASDLTDSLQGDSSTQRSSSVSGV